jgi:peptide/nickel transport system substrate-binding protein
MEMKKRVVFILAGCSMVLILALGSLALAAGPKGTIVYCSDSSSWGAKAAYDPHTRQGAPGVVLTSLVWDSLITEDEKGAFQPALADSWKLADDASTVDFTLHKGVTFHNGDPFTAKDVKFSLERAARDDLRFVYGADLKRYIKSVQILDDYHVRILLKEPFAAIMDRVFLTAIVPKNYIEKVGDAGFVAKPVGAGPFRVVKFSRDVSFEVEAVENHYRKTPYVKKFTVLSVSEAGTRMAMLKRGEADIVRLLNAHVPLVEKDPNLKVLWSHDTLVQTLAFFDLSHPEASPFKDLRVRKATSLAIDREGIAKALTFGAYKPWGTFFAPYNAGFNSKHKPDPYNPKEAKRLLAEAGYANGFDTVLTSHHTTVRQYQAIQQQLGEVGIRAKLEVPEHGTWVKMFTSGNLHGIGFSAGPYWAGRIHSGAAVASYITGQWSHNLQTPEITKAMNSLLVAVKDSVVAERARELDKILLREQRLIPLWSSSVPYGAGPKVEEFPGIPGLPHPQGFEYLKIKDK